MISRFRSFIRTELFPKVYLNPNDLWVKEQEQLIGTMITEATFQTLEGKKLKTIEENVAENIKYPYEVFRRNDIDWNHVRTSGDKRFIGKTNAEAFGSGLAPQLPDGGFATLHHIGQDSRGPLAEASTRYHGVGKYGRDILHSQFGKSKPNPSFPIDRKKFNADTREYWKFRVENK
ncbi:HNH/ENDO VII family nuclease [Psychrobacillus psychrotolerans]|nr:HNH/ENDO VII family nuclease [Psychrobacillus psychrotolerans]